MPALNNMEVFRNFASKNVKNHKNKTISFVLDRPCRSHVGISELKVLSWIPVSERAKQINLCKVYSVVHWSAPKYPKMEFTMVSERHSISTRHRVQSLVLQHVK